MGKLQIKKVTRDVEKIPFECGMDSINLYVKNSYFPTITQDAYAYSISSGDTILGYYQVLFREIELDQFPQEIADYDSGVKGSKVSAIHIRYIAIDKKYQGHKIGTYVLRKIIKDVENVSGEWPVRVITIDARTELVNWYTREGFVKMKDNTPGQDGVTVAMYIDCMRYLGDLAEYIDDICS